MKKNNIHPVLFVMTFLLMGLFGGLIVSMGLSVVIESFERSLLMDMATWVAVVVAAIAGFIALKAYNEQVESKKITLWRDLTKEFDHDMNRDRYRSGSDYKRGFETTGNSLSEIPTPIVDFFETIGFLVRANQLPQELTKHTFLHAFDAYYRASWKYIKLENKKSFNKAIYRDILWLHEYWGHDKAFEKVGELEDFFQDEKSRVDINYGD